MVSASTPWWSTGSGAACSTRSRDRGGGGGGGGFFPRHDDTSGSDGATAPRGRLRSRPVAGARMTSRLAPGLATGEQREDQREGESMAEEPVATRNTEQASGAGAAIEDYLVEDRTFPPPESFKADALVSGVEIYDEAAADWQGFWARQAADLVTWYDEWHTVLEWDRPFARWFVGGTLNVSANCLDRHVEAGRGDKVAYHWEGEPGDTRTITYADLLAEVQRFANVLKGLGVRRGDRVAIYMPMIPELPVAMLACARIGAPHSVVFGGFSADSLSGRINDAECKVLVTADGGFRRGQAHLLKPIADVALASAPSVEDVVVVRRGGGPPPAAGAGGGP